MVAWMDDEALHRTLTTGRATYWSRSRGSTGSRARPPATTSTSGRWRWTATATRCWSGVDQVGAGLPHRRAHLLLHRTRRSTLTAGSVLVTDRRRQPGPSRRFRELARGPSGGAGDPAAAGRRRDPGGGLPQAGRRAGHLPAGVRRAGRRLGRHGLVAVLVHRGAQQRHPDRAGRRGALARHPAGRGADRRRPGAACCGRRSRRSPAAAARTRVPALPPLTGGLVGYLSLRPGPPVRAAAGADRRRPARCPSWA